MIVPIVQGLWRCHLAVEDDHRGLASVEVVHSKLGARGRDLIEIVVTTDEPDAVAIKTTVQAR